MEKWDSGNNIYLRLLLFFKLTGLDVDCVKGCIDSNRKIFKNVNSVYEKFCLYLYSIIDEFFAPFIIREISLQQSDLQGETPEKRYANFFISENMDWQPTALRINEIYKEQIALIKKLIDYEIRSFILFVNRLSTDLSEIQNYFAIQSTFVKSIKIFESDRHNFSGPIILVRFENNQEIVYKSKDGQSGLFFENLIKILKLEQYILAPKTLNKKNYYWSPFISYERYSKENDIKTVYKNFGLLLSICDIFNYTDGHAENFISHDKQFVLIDSETFLTNLSYFANRADNYFDLSFTGMIPYGNKKIPYQPLLRNKVKLSFFPYKPYVINDGTDLLKLNYKQVVKNCSDYSFPSDKKVKLSRYLLSIKEGLKCGYQCILENEREILFFLRHINPCMRQIIRPTLYYVWLMHRYLHPDNRFFSAFLKKNTNNFGLNISTYENSFIKFANIPVFYHKLHSKHLYGYKNNIIEKKYFSKTAYYWIKLKLKNLKNENFITKRLEEVSRFIGKKKS